MDSLVHHSRTPLGTPKLNGKPPLQEGRYYWYVGQVTASQRIAILLEAFVGLNKYDLLIVGDGDLRLRVQRQDAGYPHIRFLGSLPQHQLGF